MKWHTAIVVVGVLCALSSGDAASLRESEGVSEAQFGASPHLVGGATLGRYDHHTYAIRLKLSNSTKQTTGFQFCSGVRLSDGWLLTAAECLQIPGFKFIRITSPDGFAFKHYFYEIEEPSKRTRPEMTYKIHPNYSNVTKMNNIALIRSDFITVPPSAFNPILPYIIDKTEDLVGLVATITSYDNIPGHFTDDDREYVNSLDVGIVNPKICKDIFFPGPSTTPKPTTPKPSTTQGPASTPKIVWASPHMNIWEMENFICVGASPAKGPTKRDMGAPLIYQKNKFSEKKLIGTLAAVVMFSGNQNYALFAKIGPLSQWISETTRIPLVYEPKTWN